MFSIIQAAGWPIWPLIASSILALAIVIERFSALVESKVAPKGLADTVIAVTQKGLPSKDSLADLEQNSMLGEVLASALHLLKTKPKASQEELRAAVQTAGRGMAHRLEAHMTILATVASSAPLMGLLGTVVGMIEIFGAQSAGAAGASNPVQLAQGISMALYNTAFGLMVAIPSLVFWRYFRARIDSYLLTLESSLKRQVYMEKAAQQMANGLGDPRQMYVRFG